MKSELSKLNKKLYEYLLDKNIINSKECIIYKELKALLKESYDKGKEKGYYKGFKDYRY